ncbi:hypothetical protein BDQ12DRAFT_647608 [Crucibulum laeve]|uniref:Uncharacterized protein n=1 Tax=Crucibulum laeve TaxID=68775 RepID=A0A5C3MHD2_9AGAR|nr:hypothetical protein BDQ12DRAFT_647608 [Crucibulum laeve]
MPPKATRALVADLEHEKQALADISSTLASVLAENPKLTHEQAIEQTRLRMLKNNPFVPPEGDKCPVNDLPTELLAYIFRVGVDMQREEMELGTDDDEEEEYEQALDGVWDEEDSDEDEEVKLMKRRAGKQKASLPLNADEPDVKADDGDEEWEDEDAEDDEEEEEPEEPELPFQVLASHVCKHWREVALNAPQLWTSLNFLEGKPFEKSRTYIERAKGMPLDIYINATIPESMDAEDHPDHPNYVPPEGDEHCEDPTHDHTPIMPFFSHQEVEMIFDIIIPHVAQWRSFEISATLYNIMHALLQRLSKAGPAPLLETFQLYHYEECDDYGVFEPAELGESFKIFDGQAPKLEQVALWGVHLNWDASLSILRGLYDLELAYHAKNVRPSWETFTTMLKNNPELRVLSLCMSGPAGEGTDEEWGRDPLEIPSVKELVLCYHEPEYAVALVQHLDLPNLQALTLDYDEQDYNILGEQLCKPVRGKTKSLLAGLEHLKISGLPCSDQTADKVLEQLAELKSINLNCSGDEEMVYFNKLMKPSSSAAGAKVYCPLLESLSTTGVEGAQIRAFVDSRIKAGHPVKKVFICEEDDVDPKDETWLRDRVETLEFFEASDSEDEIFELDDEMDVDSDVEAGLD